MIMSAAKMMDMKCGFFIFFAFRGRLIIQSAFGDGNQDNKKMNCPSTTDACLDSDGLGTWQAVRQGRCQNCRRFLQTKQQQGEGVRRNWLFVYAASFCHEGFLRFPNVVQWHVGFVTRPLHCYEYLSFWKPPYRQISYQLQRASWNRQKTYLSVYVVSQSVSIFKIKLGLSEQVRYIRDTL